ncbi:MAG: RDD family protein [Fimbriimonadaceae bacterium]|nr:RDD family protein [Fimbriimonadaceae bacterium]
MSDAALILTPEKTLIAIQSASLSRRMSAQIVDLLLIFGITTFISMIMAPLSLLGSAAIEGFIGFLATALFFAYFAIFESVWNGQTPGKKAVNIRVMSADGTPIAPGQAWFRNLLRIADFLPGLYLIGFSVAFLNPRGLRLGDLAAGTIVVEDPRPPKAIAPAVHTYGVHHFEQYISNLNEVSLEEYLTMKRLCDRFPFLPVQEQQRSLEDIWEPFRERHRIPHYGNVHPIFIMEAVVMKFSRLHHLV